MNHEELEKALQRMAEAIAKKREEWGRSWPAGLSQEGKNLTDEQAAVAAMLGLREYMNDEQMVFYRP